MVSITIPPTITTQPEQDLIYDILIIGGGISGLGIFAEAARQGYRVILCERNTLCAGTSSNSLRIIHGGFRYLQTLDIGRTIQSNSDQAKLLKISPKIITPIPCIMPLSKFGLKSAIPVSAAIWLYRALTTLSSNPLPPPKILTNDEAASLFTNFPKIAPHGALQWYDALMPNNVAIPNYLLQSLINPANSTVLLHTQINRIAIENELAATTATKNGLELLLKSKLVINCAGYQTRNISLTGVPSRPQTQWCKAVNIVMNSCISPTHALGLQAKSGRLLFFVPRNQHTAVGTWYFECDNSPSTPTITTTEINSIVTDLASILSTAVTLSHILHYDIGMLPLKEIRNNEPVPKGKEGIYLAGRYCEVISTKYTTFASQARKVLKKVKHILE